MASKQSRPNILLIFADQMRAGMTGVEGNAQAITPHMDRLAAQGVLVNHCIANSPVCGPSRGTIFTGTYPTTHGVISNDLAVRTDLPTLASVARDAGYRTGYIGKWHLDGVPRSKFTPPGERRLGFDDFWAAYNCNHDYYNTRYYRDTDELIRSSAYEPETQTDLVLEFLSDSIHDTRPFCLALSWGPPHDPYAKVPQQYRDQFDPASISPRPNVVVPGDNPLSQKLEFAQAQADYYAAITALDDQLARILDALHANGQEQNTIVVFTSDHGDMLWSHGWMKKQSPFEESIHVPLIVRAPGLPPDTRRDLLLGLVDLMPTLLGLAGLPVPVTVEGRDLSSALRGHPASPPPDAQLILNQHSSDEAYTQGMPEWRGVRSLTHTYVEQVPGLPWLLFDNLADPYQMNNLINDPAHQQLQARMSRRLHEMLEQTNDPFTPGVVMLDQFGLTHDWRYRMIHIND